MSPFEYLSVLISIVLALGMTRVVAGLGEMLQVHSRKSIYWVHAVWVANLFLFLVVAWWIFYRWRAQAEWTYFLFVFVLISPILLYLAAVVLFPPERREGQTEGADYRAYFYRNHRSFFILFALWVPVDVADTLLKGTTHFLSLGPAYVASAVILSVVLVTAAVTRNERYHAFAAVYFFCHTIAISFLFFHTLV